MRNCPACNTPNPDEAKFCFSCGAPLPAQVTGEVRKVVTVVFCDLTGSTALGESLDPETLRRIITRYFNEMKATLTKHGGTVEKFIGDAVMAAFGIPVLHEDDALRAVRAANDMQRVMASMNEELQLQYGKALYARIGVNTGEVIAGDSSEGHGFASGDTINVAARLEQAAEPGTVLIGEPTYRLVRDAVEVQPVEPLTLKGKSEPVPAYKLIDVTGGEGRSRRLDSKLVGREKELTALKSGFDKALQENKAQLVTIFGSAGVGKSRLVLEFTRSLGDSARVVEGRCLPYGEGITFWPVSEAVKSLCAIAEEDEPAVAIAKITSFLPEGDEAAMVVDRIAGALGLTGAAQNTQETFWAVRRFFEQVASEKPLVVLFDDIHWAEATMLDLIEYLATFSAGQPILVLCLARRDLLDVRPAWGRATASTTILLPPLSEEETDGLIATLLSEAQLPAHAQQEIRSAAEGNPLYVEEILKMLIDDGVLTRSNGSWKPTGDLSRLAIPPTIQALVAARLDKLSSGEREVVQRGSVVGKEFWWDAISKLSDEELSSALGHHLQALVRKELIQPTQSIFFGEDAFRFGHIMIRDAAYQGMQKAERADLHQRFAAWLEAKVGDRIREYEEILGYHLEQAFLLRQELGEVDEVTKELGSSAAEHLTSSGRRALTRTDMPAAVNLLGRAVELLPIKDPLRAEVSLDLSDALMEVGELERATATIEQLIRLTEALSDERLEARARIQKLIVGQFAGEQTEDPIKQVEALIGVFEKNEDHIGLTRAYQMIADVRWDALQTAQAEEALERALHHAQAAGSSLETAKILAWLSSAAFWGPRPVEEGIDLCRRILEMAKENQLVQARCKQSLACLEAARENFDEARALVKQSLQIQQELGQTLYFASGTQAAGLIELMADDPEAAETEFRRGYDMLAELGEAGYLATSAALLARALYTQGRFDEAESFTVVSEQAGEGDEALKAEWGPTRARILARKGDLEAADRLAMEALDFTTKADDPILLGYSVMTMAEVHLLAGKMNTAVPLIRSAAEIYEGKGIVPWARKARGLLDQIEAASAT